VHGREAVVIIAAEEFRRLEGGATGAALVTAMQSSPFREIELAPKGMPMPVRGVGLK
jgi:hypothetical protein